MSISYPTEFPTAEVKSLITAISNKSFVANRQSLIKDIWVIQGYVIEKGIGEPLPVGVVQSLSDDIMLTTLQVAVDSKQFLGLPTTLLLKWLLNIVIGML